MDTIYSLEKSSLSLPYHSSFKAHLNIFFLSPPSQIIQQKQKHMHKHKLRKAHYSHLLTRGCCSRCSQEEGATSLGGIQTPQMRLALTCKSLIVQQTCRKFFRHKTHKENPDMPNGFYWMRICFFFFFFKGIHWILITLLQGKQLVQEISNWKQNCRQNNYRKVRYLVWIKSPLLAVTNTNQRRTNKTLGNRKKCITYNLVVIQIKLQIVGQIKVNNHAAPLAYAALNTKGTIRFVWHFSIEWKAMLIDDKLSCIDLQARVTF